MRILITSGTYVKTAGAHHDVLNAKGWDLVCVEGPLSEARMLELVGDFDGFICTDDVISEAVIEKALPRLKVISKYGIGVDKIALGYAEEKGVAVLNTPGVNHHAVAEHTFALILAQARGLAEAIESTRTGGWKASMGTELWGKRIGIVGLGRIGVEVARRARGFGMKVDGFGHYWPEAEAEMLGITRYSALGSLVEKADFLSLHTKLTERTRYLIDAEVLGQMKPGAVLVNCGRGELVDAGAVIAALDSGRLRAYVTDVLEVEPPRMNEPLMRHAKVLVTPHIGSRTIESVSRQAIMTTYNLIHYLTGEGEYVRVN